MQVDAQARVSFNRDLVRGLWSTAIAPAWVDVGDSRQRVDVLGTCGLRPVWSRANERVRLTPRWRCK